MILRRDEGDCTGPICDDEDRELLAFHEFLEENRRPGFAEHAVGQHPPHRRPRLSDLVADDDALAGGEA